MTVMLMMVAFMSIWGLMGTATYRRVGALALESGKQRHFPGCKTQNSHEREFGKCLECAQYESVALNHDHNSWCSSFGYGRKDYPRYKYATRPRNPQPPKWTYEVCKCDPKAIRKIVLAPAMIKSYTAWPVLMVAYLYINAQKAYILHKGEDWSFFVQPKMVQTRQEKRDALDKAIAKGEKELAAITQKMEELQNG